MNGPGGLAIGPVSPVCPLERASSLLLSHQIAGIFLLQGVPQMSVRVGRLSLPGAGEGREG